MIYHFDSIMISTGIMLRSIDISEQIINQVQAEPRHTTQSSVWMRTNVPTCPVVRRNAKLQRCVNLHYPPCDAARSAESWLKWWTFGTQSLYSEIYMLMCDFVLQHFFVMGDSSFVESPALFNNNNNNNNTLLHLGCYPVAVVILHIYKT